MDTSYSQRGHDRVKGLGTRALGLGTGEGLGMFKVGLAIVS